VQEDGFIMVSNKKAARRTPPTQAKPAAAPTRAAATATPQRTTLPNPIVISSPSDEDEDDNDDNEDKENRGFPRVNEEEDYSDEGDEDSKATTEPGLLRPRPRLTRELRALGATTPRSTGTEESKDDDEVVEAIYSAVTSNPGVTQTFEEAFFGPNKEFWRPAIYEELVSFSGNKRNKMQIVQQLKRKLMTTKWIFKEKSPLMGQSSTKPDVSQEDSCRYQELITQSHLHQ
jgi:hypothetical protein